jgi:hypothetical protein
VERGGTQQNGACEDSPFKVGNVESITYSENLRKIMQSSINKVMKINLLHSDLKRAGLRGKASNRNPSLRLCPGDRFFPKGGGFKRATLHLCSTYFAVTIFNHIP